MRGKKLSGQPYIIFLFRFWRIFSCLTRHGALTIVLSTFDCSDSGLFMWLVAAVPHNGIPYDQVGFIIVL